MQQVPGSDDPRGVWPGSRGRCAARRGRPRRDSHPQRVAVVLGEIVTKARDLGVHLGTAELLLGRDLAGGGLEQGWPGEEGAGAAAHHHDVVGQPGLVRAAGGRGAVRHGDDGKPGRGQPRQIAEDVAAANEILDPVTQQIGAGALDQLHIGQLVLQRELLHPQRLVETVGLQRARIDAGVIGVDHAADAGDEADPGNQSAAGHALVRIRHIEHVAGERRQFEEWRAGIEHQRDALARQQLAALVEAILGGGGGRARALLQSSHPGDQRQHAVAIALEPDAAGGNRVLDDGHGITSSRHSGMRQRRRPQMRNCASGNPYSRSW